MQYNATANQVRIEARVKNNVLWHAIYGRYASVNKFCRQNGFVPTRISELLNLRVSPFLRREPGSFRPTCVRLAKVLGLAPEILFPEELYGLPRTQATFEIPISALPAPAKLLQLPAATTPFEEMVSDELRRTLAEAVGTLAPREAEVIRRRFVDGETLDAIGADLGVTRERIRAIEARALKRLRHPSRAKTIKDFVEPDR